MTLSVVNQQSLSMPTKEIWGVGSSKQMQGDTFPAFTKNFSGGLMSMTAATNAFLIDTSIRRKRVLQQIAILASSEDQRIHPLFP
jgi:hypothetical protein